jgi:hypothetical protein
MLRDITLQTIQSKTARIPYFRPNPSKTQKRVKFDADGNLPPSSSDVLICCHGGGKAAEEADQVAASNSE